MTTHKILFPTFAIGSLPRENWVLEILDSFNSGALSEEKTNRLLNGAIVGVIRMQEKAGMDCVSDGEWRRNNYLRVFVDAVHGYKLDAIPPNRFSTSTLPAIVSKIHPHSSMSIKAASFLKKNARVRTIVSLPSPHTVGGKMWDAKLSTKAYANPKESIEACIPIINNELRNLADLGIDEVQLDEPWLCDVANPTYQISESIKYIDKELEVYVRSINDVVKGVKGPSVSLHVCGHTSPTTSYNSDWAYDALMEAISKMNVDRVTIAMTGPNLEGFKVLKAFPQNKLIGLGVLPTRNPEAETPRTIVERVERAMEFVPKEHITLNPECGFSPFTRNLGDLNKVYLGLKSMCQAAAMLRKKHG